MDTAQKPIRKGKVVTFSLDYDAYGLLLALQPSKKCYGTLLSELLRKEARERSQRLALLDALQARAEATCP
jgi:hypothetical protein